MRAFQKKTVLTNKNLLNAKKNISGSAPLLVKLGGEKRQLVRNEILKAARELKKYKISECFHQP